MDPSGNNYLEELQETYGESGTGFWYRGDYYSQDGDGNWTGSYSGRSPSGGSPGGSSFGIGTGNAGPSYAEWANSKAYQQSISPENKWITVGFYYGYDANGNPMTNNGVNGEFWIYETSPFNYSNAAANSGSDINWSMIGNTSFFSGIALSGIGYAATQSAEQTFQYSSIAGAEAEAAAARVLKGIANGTKVLGYTAAGVGVISGFMNFAVSNHRWGDYGRLGISLTSTLLTVYTPTAPIGLTIGFIEALGGFNGVYNYLNANNDLYDKTGGLMVPGPATGIPSYYQLK